MAPGNDNTETPKDNVLYPFTGRLTPPPSQDDKPVIDEDAVALLEDLLERFRAGQLQGLVAVAGVFDKNGRLLDCATALSPSVLDNAFAFVGGIELMKSDILETFKPFLVEDDG